MPTQLTARALDALLRSGANGGGPTPLLLDVREPWEFAVCHLAGAQLLPMRQVAGGLGPLDPNAPVVVICHHGIRSQQVALYLERQGFTQVSNLQGGVAAWAAEVDPGMGTY